MKIYSLSEVSFSFASEESIEKSSSFASNTDRDSSIEQRARNVRMTVLFSQDELGNKKNFKEKHERL
ncbi:MAG: hypothetical protein Q7J16_06125 [Candidatus Cloacimonadales bacterium]|nr:hypothetical protein [Candidatus Cloacimonadales bacterium]